MPIELATVCTAGSMIHMEAPMLVTVAERVIRTPINMEVMANIIHEYGECVAH